jgi:PAS domain S-box-containing protein
VSKPVIDPVEFEALQRIVAGTVGTTGTEFFRQLTRHLCEAIDVHFAMVTEFSEVRTRIRALAFCARGEFVDNVEYDLAGTPCEDVVRGSLCHHPNGVQQLFPTDLALVEMKIDSYLGVPLQSSNGEVIGHLAAFDDRPMPSHPRHLLVFKLFAARAASELERWRMKLALEASERQFRDLFDQAPIAYVHEDLDSQFIKANKAALRILGVKPEEVPTMNGRSLAPDTPEAQKRIQEAFAAIGRGTDARGVILELRRKDNNAPLWIEWWSSPDPSGTFTRTMFIDITERVLMEQEKARLTAQNAYLQEELKSVHNFEEIVGRSPALLDVIDRIQRVATTDATVLITGETGTGKELFARAVHSASQRSTKPLIKINCAALPPSLVESELFGHEKGAFSGAIQRRIGRFELANGGTIFLDEVGEIPPEVQVKLLRVLQEREFERVGGSEPIKIDVRVIAATNRDLVQAIKDNMFREDLFYRLNVFPITLPPLRERSGDVPLLAHFLVNKFASRIGRAITSISPDSMEFLVSYHWPGNIRELENILERAIILSNNSVLEIDPSILGLSLTRASSPANTSAADPTPSSTSLESIERNHILEVLKQTGWVIEGPQGAAKILDLHPNTLRSRLKRLGIERPTHDMS